MHDAPGLGLSLIHIWKPGDKASYEYRLRRQDGSPCWIIGSAEVLSDSSNQTYIQSVYLDINESKKAEQRNQRLTDQLEASDKVLHMALEHTTTSEFYYYPDTRECMVPARTSELYCCQEHYDNLPCSFAMEQVDEPFRPAFYEMYGRIHQGARTASCEFRGRNQAFWCRQTLSVILRNGKPADLDLSIPAIRLSAV